MPSEDEGTCPRNAVGYRDCGPSSQWAALFQEVLRGPRTQHSLGVQTNELQVINDESFLFILPAGQEVALAHVGRRQHSSGRHNGVVQTRLTLFGEAPAGQRYVWQEGSAFAIVNTVLLAVSDLSGLPPVKPPVMKILHSYSI
eukprot:RCo035790